MKALPLLLLLGVCALAKPGDFADSATPTAGGGVTPTPEVVLLGTAQDGGRPHPGCWKPCCEGREREPVASLGIRGRTGWWLVDATPDFPAQVASMGEMPRGILLTHAHIGHYLGLAWLGREAASTESMPVWCGPRMAEFLRENGPWSQLVELGQIELNAFQPGTVIPLEEGLEVVALQVPHRDEFSGTFAFLVRRPQGGSLLHAPDIDAWDGLEPSLESLAQACDHLLLDGTFFSADELPGRDLADIPHPLVTSTMDLLESVPGRGAVRFIHLNHSNPLLKPGSDAAVSVVERGFGTARTGERIPPPAPRKPLASWNSPGSAGPVLVGVVTHPDGRPLEGIKVTSHAGFATRFSLASVRTDAQGRYRFDPVSGSPVSSGDGPMDSLCVGVCVGSVSEVNPPEFLPWEDIRVKALPGVVARLDFTFDPASVPEEVRGE